MKNTIPKLIKNINTCEDPELLLEFENRFACLIASPLMFLTAITNYLVLHLIFERNFFDVLFNTVAFIFLGILFEVLIRIKINPRVVAIFVSILYGFISILVIIRLFEYMGPSVWMVFCLQLGFSIYRSRKDMAIGVGVSTIITSGYVLFNIEDFSTFSLRTFFISQFILIVLIYIVFSALHKMNINRISKLNNKIETIIEQNNDIAALYEEISATEEELRNQNIKIQERDKELFNMAYFDSLTGLPNRIMFTDYLEELIVSCQRKECGFYLVSIDIDFFKKINDTMGHHIGDIFIKFVADRLKNSINPADFLCRTGGDEFSLVISRDVESKNVLRELNYLRKKFYAPFRVKDSEFRLTASFGVAIFPRDGDTFSDIVKHADMALNQTKEIGKNQVRFFNNDIKNLIVEKTNIENEMLKGLNNKEFFLVFQPQYNLHKEGIRSFEVLTRWNSSLLGTVPPLKFIPIAEETGFINLLGNWILKTSCLKFKELKEKYPLKEVLLSVNISSVQLRNANFIAMVKKVLKETKFDPKCLEFEITESICIESFEEVYGILSELRSLGIKIALDDFGTGYSSLSYLKLLPVDTLKIDKLFIDEIIVEDSKSKVVSDIISLGHSLGFEIVAEGVEFLQQKDYLKNHHCNYVQGFLMNKPLTINEIHDLFDA